MNKNIASSDKQSGIYSASDSATNSLKVKASLAEVKQRKDIVFIDPQVDNYQNLVAGTQPGTEVIVLDAARDGVEQITEVLANRSNINSVHIVSHGGSGNLRLGAARLNSETVNNYAAQLQNWSKALTADADILLYGCDVAGGETGEKFVQKLSDLTGADIAASTDLTGSSVLGGDWDLEKLTGSIESPLAFQADAIADYQSVLVDCVPNVIYAIANGRVLITSVNTGGTITPAVPNTLPFSPQAVARDPLSSTNLLYYLEASTNGRLGTWNPVTGAATVLGNSTIPGSSPRMAFRDNGVMYAMVGNNLYTVSTGTGTGTTAAAQAINSAAAGTTTLVAAVPGATGSGDMAFDPNSPNDLYIVSGGTMFKVDINNPTATPVSGATGLPSSPGVAFGPDGFLYAGTGTGLLARLNTTVGPTFGNQIGTPLSTIASINDFATLPTPSPDTDLAVTKTDGQTSATPGTALTYTITVTNNGDCDLKGISFADNIPTSLTGVTWTASISGGGSFPSAADASGSGNNINTKINLNSGATATYIVTGTVSNSALGTTITNTATATPPEGITDRITTNNNSASDATDVLPPNVPPVTNSPNAEVTPGNTLQLPGLGATDSDGTIASYTINTLPPAAQGVLYLGDPTQGGVPITAGQVLTPAQIGQVFLQSTGGFTGTNFAYSATDNRGDTTPGTATISPVPNVPPVTNSPSAAVTPGTTIPLTGLGATDPDGTIASYTVNTLPPVAEGVLFLGDPANGGVPVTAGQTLTPAQIGQLFFQSTGAFNGTNFTYSATDNRGGTTPGTTTISPTPNQPPVTNNTSVLATPGSAVPIPGLGATDPDGTIASYTINTLPLAAEGVLFLGNPAAGGVPVTAGQVLTPAQIGQLFFQSTGAFAGTNFTYSGTDNRGATTPGTATLAPTPNQPPLTNNSNSSVVPGGVVQIPGLGATDPDGTIASYTVNTLPPATEGVLFLGNPTTGGVPVTAGQTLTPAQINQLFFQSTGTFAGTNFSYSATDNRGTSSPGTAAIAPTPNQPPVTNNTNASVIPGSSVPLTGLGATDADGTIASYTIDTLPPAAQGVLYLGDPTQGGVPIAAGQVLTPAQIGQVFLQSTAGFTGTNFTYSATDNRGANTPAAATVSPTPNQPPSANNTNDSVTPGATIPLTGLGGTDPDGTIASYTINTLPPATAGVLFLGDPATGGTAVTAGQTLTPAQIGQLFFQSTGAFNGTNFTYSATDNRGTTSGAATTTLSPTPNQPPATNNANNQVVPGNTLALTGLGATDPDGTIASYTVNTLPPATEGVLFLGDPTQGGVAVTAGQVLTPAQIGQLFFQSTGAFAGTNFNYTATDNRGATSAGTSTISPTPNQPPVANNTNNSLAPGSTLPLTGLGGNDPDGTIASYTINTLPPAAEGVLFLGDPASGGVAVTAGQVLTPAQISQLFFQSTGAFAGTNFTYSVTDNRGANTAATSTLSVTPNQPPVANNTNSSVAPGSTIALAGLGGTDPDGTIASYTINTLPPAAQGVLFLGDPASSGVAVTAGQVLTPAQIGQLFFQSTGAFSGANFTYSATDNRNTSSPAATATVSPTPNQPPVANNTNSSVAPGSTVALTGLGGTDPDGTIASYTINTLPPAAQGVLFLGNPASGGTAVTAGQVLTPAQIGQLFFQSTNALSSANFSYSATDNRGASSPGTVDLSATVNQPPAANNTNSSLAPGSTLALTGLGGTDPDGTVASYTINTLPTAAQGTLFLGDPASGGVAVTAGQSLTPAQITQLFFQSTGTFNGSNFTYSAIDNRGTTSPAATASLSPTANQPPVANNANTSVVAGNTVPITGLGGTDPDGTIASYTIGGLPPAAQGVLFLGNPAAGGTAITAGQTLTPAQITQLFFQSTGAFTGTNFTYSATDNRGASSPATATIAAGTPANNPPVANNVSLTTAPGSTLAVTGLGGSDSDGNVNSFTIDSLPPASQGVLFRGDPANNGTAVTIGQTLTPGQLGQLFFQATGNFSGTTFTYSAIDNQNATSPGPATVNLTPTANRPPVANNVNASVIPGNTVAVTGLGGTDPDGTIASYTINTLPPTAQGVLFLGDPANGGVAVTVGQSLTPAQISQLFFQSTGAFTGANFTYNATDNRGASSPATATVSPIANRPPLTNNSSLSAVPGSTVTVPGLGGSDPDGTIASYTIDTLPPATQGVLFLGDPANGGTAVTVGQSLTPAQIGQLFFQSTNGFTGTTFTYSAVDNLGLSNPAAATVAANPLGNQPPVANNSNAAIAPGSTVPITGLGGTDPDGTIASYTINTLPPVAQGILFLGDPILGGVAVTAGQVLTPAQIGQLFFQSTGTFAGTNFTYSATDNRGASSPGTATLTANAAVNQPPVANNASVSAVPGSTVPVNGLGGSDPDGTIASYTIDTLPPAAQGVLFLGDPANGGTAVTVGQSLTPAQIGQLFFQSAGTFTGTSFNYSAVDNLGLSSPGSATVAANPIANRPPVANNINDLVAPGSTLQIAGLGGSDPDGTIASYTINTLPPAAQGTLFLGDPASGGVAVTAGQVLTPAQINQLFFRSAGTFSGANFTYSATDNRGASSPGTATLTANAGVNEPPLANNASFLAAPGSAVPIAGLGGSDPDGTIASYTIDTLPTAAQGVLYLGNPASGGVPITVGQVLTPAQIGQLFFQSTGTFTGTNFTYSAVDNLGLKSPAAATVAATASANLPPLATNANTVLAPGSVAPVTGLGGTDPDGTIASYTIDTLPAATEGVLFLGNPASGGVAVTAGQTLTPAQIGQLFFQATGAFNGANFTYNATDNRGASSPATVALAPSTAANQPPLTNNANVSGLPGGTLPVAGLGGTDPNGTIGSYRIDTLPPADQGVLFLGDPANGGVPVTAGQTLTPAQSAQLFFRSTTGFANANFTYTAIDNLGIPSPSPATVALSATPNQPPVANNSNAVVAPGSIVGIAGLGGTDPDGTVASYTIDTLPPAAQGILFLGNPTQGGVAVTAGQRLTPEQINQLFFQSAGTFTGANFNYSATDNRGASGRGTASINPPATVNQPPVANNANSLVAPNAVVRIPGLGGTDPDGTIASYTINTLPPAAQGTLFLGDPASGGVAVTAGQSLTPEQINQLFFRSTGAFTGANFTYSATDNLGLVSPGAATATVSPTLTDLNQPPITRNINTSTAPGNVLQLTDLGGADPDGTIVSYTIDTLPPAAQGVLFLGNPAQGGVAVTAGQTLTAEQINQLFFQSAGEFAGTNFTYTATDNGGAVSNRSTATIDVTGAPTPTPTPTSTSTPTPTPALPNVPAPAIPGELPATPVAESEAGCKCPPLPEKPQPNFLAPLPPPLASFDKPDAEQTPVQQIWNGTSDSDFLVGTDADEKFISSEGNDLIFSEGGKDLIYGKENSDFISASRGDDVVYSGKGRDLTFAGKGNDWILGDTESDTLFGDLGGDTIIGDNGKYNGNPAHSANNFDWLFGEGGSDLIGGNEGDDRIFAGKGDDLIHGGRDNDRMWGELGNDTLEGDAGEDSLYGGLSDGLASKFDGKDWLYGGSGNDFLNGKEENDTLVGGTGNDISYGGKGDDRIFGETDADTLFGGEGKDTIVGDYGNLVDNILGQADLIFGDRGADAIAGGNGNDTIEAGKDDDCVFGGKQNDLIWGEIGSDTIAGDEGNDTIYGGVRGALMLDAQGRDLLFGNAGFDYINGDESNDSISGGLDGDTLYGGKDADFLYGDGGADLMFGDNGNDILCGGDEGDTIFGDNIGASVAVGAAGQQDCIDGGAGNDIINGNEGQDTITGDEGGDTLTGGKDNDQVFGGAGDDWLFGDLGEDILNGGAGSDRFVLNSGSGIDTITNFEVGIDKFVLSGGLSLQQLQIGQTPDSTLLQVAGTGEVLARLIGANNQISLSDFVLV